MNILVTGGLGFVGINLVRTLAESGENRVVVADLLPYDEGCVRFLAPVQDRVMVERLDVCDANALSQLIQQYQITHIVHTAAITVSDHQERQRAGEVVQVNLVGAINILNAAIQIDSVERVLLVSSSGVYGTPDRRRKRPQRESDRLNLSNLYAITKYSAELLATRYAQLSGKAMASVRLAAVYGPMERVLSSRSNMSAVGRLMAALHRQRAGQTNPVTVAGAQVARDWSYAAEIGKAIYGLLGAAGWHYPVYNVSCGVAYSLAEVVKIFETHGLAVTWVEEARQAEIAMLPHQARAPLSIERLQGETGFRPSDSLESAIGHWLGQGVG